jgi:hypothetical protein
MGREAQWWDLGQGVGVLELPESDAGDAFELHVIVAAGLTFAWWENERGAWLADVDAGVA